MKFELNQAGIEVLEALSKMVNLPPEEILKTALNEYIDRQLKIAKKKIEDFERRKMIQEHMAQACKGYAEIDKLRSEIGDLEKEIFA